MSISGSVKKPGTLFSGDVIYDGTLLDKLNGSDIEQYIESMDAFGIRNSATILIPALKVAPHKLHGDV